MGYHNYIIQKQTLVRIFVFVWCHYDMFLSFVLAMECLDKFCWALYVISFLCGYFQPILTVEKKAFDHQHFHNEVFSNNNNTWVSGMMMSLHGNAFFIAEPPWGDPSIASGLWPQRPVMIWAQNVPNWLLSHIRPWVNRLSAKVI